MAPSTTDGRPALGRREIGMRGVLGEVAEVLAHLAGTGGAVEPDDVDAERVDGGEGGADLGAGEHRAGHLDGDLGLDRHVAADGGHGPAAAVDGRLQAEQVVLGLDEEQVDAALEQAAACASYWSRSSA